MIKDALTVNAGSTSVKLSVLLDGVPQAPPGDLETVLAGSYLPQVVIHRVVHGGRRTAAAIVDDSLMTELRDLTDLAPLHQPAALDALDRCRQRWPAAVQVACFDTAFHTTLPPGAYTYALPARLREQVRVYGFHGLSYGWSSRQIATAAPDARRVLVAHLGGGQSLCGILDGRSIVTTMGFTPLDGLVMSSRSGSLDPGAVLWLVRHGETSLDDVLEQQSGLMGLAGTSDMRAVLDRAEQADPDAALALEVWRHRFVREAGGCIAALGGIDVLVFTGGVGENSAAIRRLVADSLGWLGVRIAAPVAGTAARPAQEITGSGATVRTFVVPAREDLQMFAEASELLGRQNSDLAL